MELIYKTKIEFLQTINLLISPVLMFILGIVMLFRNNQESNGFTVFSIAIIILTPIQILRIVKRFELYSQILIISRPLSMTSKTNTVLKLNEIKEVIFRDIQGRFGGPVIIIDSTVMTETYRMNFSRKDISEFEIELNKLGIKTTRDRI